MHKLLIQNQRGHLQRQAGKLKVKQTHKPFWSTGKSPLCGDRDGEELGGEGAAGSTGEEDLLGFGILVSKKRPQTKSSVLLVAHLGKKVYTSLVFSLFFASRMPPMPPSHQHTHGPLPRACGQEKIRKRGGKLMNLQHHYFPPMLLRSLSSSYLRTGVIFTAAQCPVRSPLMDEA